MCSDVRLADVVEEMLQIKQNLQMVFDRKNLYIDRTLEERDEMEDIYSRNLQRIKRLIDCYLGILLKCLNNRHCNTISYL